MIFSLAGLALLASIAFFQSIHGLFSNFIMAVLTILCAAFAFSTHETIFYSFLVPYVPNYGQALALGFMFGVPLLLLRIFFDVRFGGNMSIPLTVDRAGGAVLGLVTSIICTGIILICFQLLPFDVEIMGFRRVVGTETKSVWLNPDGITTKLIGSLSSGSLSSTNSFVHQHPDYLMELHAARTVQRESLHIVPQNAISIRRVWVLPSKGVLQRDPAKGYQGILAGTFEAGAQSWWGVRVSITEAPAGDSDGRFRYTGYSWRLVGTVNDNGPKQLFATAVKRIGKSAESGKFVKFETEERYEHEARTSADSPFQELAFAIPQGFKPAFLEFKRSARVALTEGMIEDTSAPAPAAPGSAPPTRDPTVPKAQTTPTSPNGTAPASTPQPEAHAPAKPEASESEKPNQATEVDMSKGGQGRLASRSPFKAIRSDEIPVFLSASVYSGQGASIGNDTLRRGHVNAEIPADRKATGGTIQKFQSLPGNKIIQIHTDPVQAQSVYGRALSFADRKLAQYRLTDSTGEVYWPIGEVRIAKIAGKDFVEIQYHLDALTEGIPERALQDAKKIKENYLYTQDGEVIFVFFVPEEAQIRSFKSARFSYDIPGGI